MLGFLIISLGFGGTAAAMTGRALALSWRSRWQILPAVLVLAATLRFLHYALLQEALLSSAAAAGDFVLLSAIAWLSFAVARKRQMKRQYGRLDFLRPL